MGAIRVKASRGAWGETDSAARDWGWVMKFSFDAELRGADGTVLPVYCEVQGPYVGGQKSVIRLAVPAGGVTKNPPGNPCALKGHSGDFTISMEGVYWRRFPAPSRGSLRLETIELFHIERLTVLYPSMNARKEIRFHLSPISYLRSESCGVHFGDRSYSEELFVLDLPDLGATNFVTEWVTEFHRDAELPGATVVAGFSAVVDLSQGTHASDVNRLVEKFRSSLEILSVLFRQAISLHGWTYTDGVTVSSWIDPLEPNVTPSARESRGHFVAKPHGFVECATNLSHAYERADEETRSLVRNLLIAVNPHVNMRANDRFLFMFSALERVIEFARRGDQTPRSPAVTDNAVATLLEELKESVVLEGGESALDISARLEGFIRVVRNGTSVREKISAFFRVYPIMIDCCADLWPILGSDRMRGLREVRNSLAHGGSSLVPFDVVAVAEWHLAILLERAIFVLLEIALPEGICPRSNLLRRGGKGWYEREYWEVLRSKPDEPI